MLWQDRDEPAQAAHLASEWLQPVIASLQPISAGPFGMGWVPRSND